MFLIKIVFSTVFRELNAGSFKLGLLSLQRPPISSRLMTGNDDNTTARLQLTQEVGH